MKKSLYILLAVALCLLIFCAACGKDGTVDNNIDNTPDNIPVTGDDITPPDSTADDNNQLSEDSTGKPDATTPPVQDDNKALVDDNKEPDNTQQPDDSQQPDDTAISTPKKYPDDATLAANADILKLYYEFISGSTTAYSMQKNEDTNFYDGMIKGSTFFDVPDGIITNISGFSLVDFGNDGILELVMKHSGSVYPYGILFYSDEQLYLDYVVYRGMGGLTYNGIARSSGGMSGSFDIMTFSADFGCNRQPIVSHSLLIGSDYVEYKIHAEYVNNEYVITEPKVVTQDEHDSFQMTIFDQPAAQWYKFDVSLNSQEKVMTGRISSGHNCCFLLDSSFLYRLLKTIRILSRPGFSVVHFRPTGTLKVIVKNFRQFLGCLVRYHKLLNSHFVVICISGLVPLELGKTSGKHKLKLGEHKRFFVCIGYIDKIVNCSGGPKINHAKSNRSAEIIGSRIPLEKAVSIGNIGHIGVVVYNLPLRRIHGTLLKNVTEHTASRVVVKSICSQVIVDESSICVLLTCGYSTSGAGIHRSGRIGHCTKLACINPTTFSLIIAGAISIIDFNIILNQSVSVYGQAKISDCFFIVDGTYVWDLILGGIYSGVIVLENVVHLGVFGDRTEATGNNGRRVERGSDYANYLNTVAGVAHTFVRICCAIKVLDVVEVTFSPQNIYLLIVGRHAIGVC